MKSSEIIKILGVKAVLLPIAKGKKYPLIKDWQKITFDQTQIESYQRKLENHTNTGVLLGRASEHLCSIDFDDDKALDVFLENNPPLRETLRTGAKRGANLWVIMDGDYPPSHKLKNREGSAIGEWRADGNQTVIQGIHPEGVSYQLKVEAGPMKVRYSDIRWEVSPPCYIDNTDDIDNTEHTEIQIIQTNNGLCAPHSVAEKIAHTEEARLSLEKNPDLFKLYTEYIDHKFTPRQGERNGQLVAMITFLFRTVSKEAVMDLVMAYYDVNQDVYLDSRSQHQYEATSHLEAVEATWEAELTDEEKKVVAGLPPKQTEAFRICRDLAALDSDDYPPGKFFLSCRALGQRIQLTDTQANRILGQLEAVGCIKTVTKGTQHTKQNGTGKATVYSYLPAINTTKPTLSTT